MSQYNFGSGNFFAVPAGANPTPVQLGTLQETAIDFAGTSKPLYGQYQYAAAVGRGSVKVTGKAKFANINAAAYNTLFFNQTVATGMTLAALNEVGTIPSSVAYTITVANGATMSQNLGVVDALTGKPYTRVASAPTTGQYSLVDATGVFTFAVADAGHNVLISYLYTSATRGYTIVLNNSLIGAAPTFMGIFGGF